MQKDITTAFNVPPYLLERLFLNINGFSGREVILNTTDEIVRYSKFFLPYQIRVTLIFFLITGPGLPLSKLISNYASKAASHDINLLWKQKRPRELRYHYMMARPLRMDGNGMKWVSLFNGPRQVLVRHCVSISQDICKLTSSSLYQRALARSTISVLLRSSQIYHMF
jgi:hypothetical protein